MLPLMSLVRDVVVLVVVLVVVAMGAYLNPWTPTPIEEETIVAVEEVATKTTPAEVPVTIIEEPEAPVKPAPKPVPKPVEEAKPTPKVEDLGLTLTDAIDSISSLAAGQAASSTNDRVRSALVNIICTTAASGPFSSISGSGVIIDPRGVIVTNAHVAQFFLLKDYPRKDFVSCVIRTGSPAKPMYKAELLFIPPTWASDNAHKITQETPTGSGERDYALLRITGAVGPSITLPPQFPFLLVSTQAPDIGTDVIQAGYAAGFLGGINIQNDLYASSAWTRVRDIFTFNANTVDLFSLGGSIVAQQGSSGGPVANTDGVLVGVIVTSRGSGDTSTRDLNAIATSYIIRDFEVERGKSLVNVLSTNDLATEVSIYNQIFAPSARAALISALEK